MNARLFFTKKAVTPAKAGVHGETEIAGGTAVAMDARLRGHDAFLLVRAS